MTVNLKWVLVLSMCLAVLGFLAGANSEFVDLGLSPTQVKAVAAIFGLLLGIGNAANSVLVAFGMTPASRIASAAQVEGVKGIQVDPQLAPTAVQAVGDNATITTTGPNK